jgi:hypothetical protein
MARSPFQIQPDLTGIAIAYKNQEYIADMIAPRETVNAELFEWDELNIDSMYEFQDDQVGRLSAPNQVTFSSTRKPGSTVDHGLDSPVPQKDMDNYQGVGASPLAIATEGVTELVMLNREKRVADVVQTAANYKAGNTIPLSGTSQFSDYTNSNPVDAILTALDIPLVRPRVMVLSNYGWRVLRQHPKVVESVKGTGAGSDARGVVARQQVADLLELDAVYVGTTRGKATPRNVDAAVSTPARIWGKHLALLGVDPMAKLLNMNRPTFLMTAQFGNRVAGTIQDPDMGLKGGVRVRAGEMVREVIMTKECSYFFENAFA